MTLDQKALKSSLGKDSRFSGVEWCSAGEAQSQAAGFTIGASPLMFWISVGNCLFCIPAEIA